MTSDNLAAMNLAIDDLCRLRRERRETQERLEVYDRLIDRTERKVMLHLKKVTDSVESFEERMRRDTDRAPAMVEEVGT